MYAILKQDVKLTPVGSNSQCLFKLMLIKSRNNKVLYIFVFGVYTRNISIYYRTQSAK